MHRWRVSVRQRRTCDYGNFRVRTTRCVIREPLVDATVDATQRRSDVKSRRSSTFLGSAAANRGAAYDERRSSLVWGARIGRDELTIQIRDAAGPLALRGVSAYG